MTEKTCKLGLDCASMMLIPGLRAEHCENYESCKEAVALHPSLDFELVRRREEQGSIRRDVINVNRHEAARLMLMERGNPQNPESLGVIQLLEVALQRMSALQTRIAEIENVYIAPEQCEAHRYNVKRPWGTYWYNKFTAKNSIFAPVERQNNVRVLHLSHDDDPRNIEGRLGISRRDALLQSKTQLQNAIDSIDRCLELLNFNQ